VDNNEDDGEKSKDPNGGDYKKHAAAYLSPSSPAKKQRVRARAAFHDAAPTLVENMNRSAVVINRLFEQIHSMSPLVLPPYPLAAVKRQLLDQYSKVAQFEEAISDLQEKLGNERYEILFTQIFSKIDSLRKKVTKAKTKIIQLKQQLKEDSSDSDSDVIMLEGPEG
jgi:hypothetical protein